MAQKKMMLLIFAVAGITYSAIQLYDPLTVSAVSGCCVTTNDCGIGRNVHCEWTTQNCSDNLHGFCHIN